MKKRLSVCVFILTTRRCFCLDTTLCEEDAAVYCNTARTCTMLQSDLFAGDHVSFFIYFDSFPTNRRFTRLRRILLSLELIASFLINRENKDILILFRHLVTALKKRFFIVILINRFFI